MNADVQAVSLSYYRLVVMNEATHAFTLSYYWLVVMNEATHAFTLSYYWLVVMNEATHAFALTMEQTLHSLPVFACYSNLITPVIVIFEPYKFLALQNCAIHQSV